MAKSFSVEKLEAALSDTSDVYVNEGVDEQSYFAELADNIRRNLCEQFTVTGEVMPPGFPDAEVGRTISGLCIAHNAGYWLVYKPEQDRFYCFWGADAAHLGAHGISGSPLYCWSS